MQTTQDYYIYQRIKFILEQCGDSGLPSINEGAIDSTCLIQFGFNNDELLTIYKRRKSFIGYHHTFLNHYPTAKNSIHCFNLNDVIPQHYTKKDLLRVFEKKIERCPHGVISWAVCTNCETK